MNVAQALDLARSHHQAGRLADAELLYREILAAQPNQADALYLLGTLALQVERFDVAVQLLSSAAQLAPTNAACQNNLGNALRRVGSLDDAINCFERAVALQVESVEGLNNLGSALLEKGDIQRGISILRKATTLQPHSTRAWFNLGNAFKMDSRFDDAISCYRKSLELEPNNLPAMNNLGKVLKNEGLLDEAISIFQKVISLNPNYFFAHNNLGDALRRQGDLSRAESCFRRAVELRPDSAPTHWNLGIVLLTRENFAEGWKEYAWRSRAREFEFIRKEFSQPHWDGSDLCGKTILLHTEQGFGDNIQFIRYLPMMKAKGAKVLVGCEPELLPLFRGQFDVDGWILPEETLPPFDVHCPLMDLPMMFETILRTIPAAVPYLSVNSQASGYWKNRLAQLPGRKVGLAWSGRSTHYNDRNRSFPLQVMSPLAGVLGISFVSLQKGDAGRQSSGPWHLTDWTDELTDFSQTAALIANLDLVIAADTAVAHLAGALAKPVWVLLPFAADWRWMENRDDSPWYPTMRLFRQPRAGDWSRPIAKMVEELKHLSGCKGT